VGVIADYGIMVSDTSGAGVNDSVGVENLLLTGLREEKPYVFSGTLLPAGVSVK
jgi:hypothetical protein